MSSTSHVAYSFFWTVGNFLIRRGVSFVVFLLVARVLTPEDVGRVALAAALIIGLEMVVPLGLNEGLVQRRDLSDSILRGAFWMSLGIAGALTFALWALAPSLERLLDNPGFAELTRWMAFSIPLRALAVVPDAILTRGLHMRLLAMRSLVSVSISGALGLVLVFNGFGVWGLVAQQLAYGLLAAALSWQTRLVRFSLFGPLDLPHDLRRFGAGAMSSRSLQYVAEHGDDLVIGAVLGPVALGLYSLANRIYSVAFEVASGAPNLVGLPVLSRSSARSQETIERGVRLVGVGAGIAFGSLLALAPSLIVGVFGSRWAGAATALQGFSALGFSLAIRRFVRTAAYSQGRSGIAAQLDLLATTVLMVSVAAVAQYGLAAVAWAFAIQGAVLLPLDLVVLGKRLGFSAYSALRWCLLPLVVFFTTMGAGFACRAISNSDAALLSVAWCTVGAMAAGLIAGLPAYRSIAADLLASVRRR